MYIRTKTRTNPSGKTMTYAYLAMTRGYKTRSPRQKVIKYLGRVYIYPKAKEETPLIASSDSVKESLLKVLEQELINHLFTSQKKWEWENSEIIISLNELTVKNKKTTKNCCVQLNQGMLCADTLKNLIRYKAPNLTMKEISKHFAKTVVEAGINAPESAVVEIFRKIQSMINNPQQ